MSPLICALCMWVHTDPEKVKEALTVINGHAVCQQHSEAASLGSDHRHAAVLAGARL